MWGTLIDGDCGAAVATEAVAHLLLASDSVLGGDGGCYGVRTAQEGATSDRAPATAEFEWIFPYHELQQACVALRVYNYTVLALTAHAQASRRTEEATKPGRRVQM